MGQGATKITGSLITTSGNEVIVFMRLNSLKVRSLSGIVDLATPTMTLEATDQSERNVTIRQFHCFGTSTGRSFRQPLYKSIQK